MIQFLFRKSQAASSFASSTDHPREERSSKQWTNKLASLVEKPPLESTSASDEKIEDPEGQFPEHPTSLYNTSLRLEGPYFTPAEPASYDAVICLVAGTGISGAIAIAAAFSAQRVPQESVQSLAQNGTSLNQRIESPPPRVATWKRCIILWSVRESDYINLPFFREETPGLEIRPHLTGKGHQRLDARQAIEEICNNSSTPASGGRTWVYISGPNPFIEAGESACRAKGVAYFGARWS